MMRNFTDETLMAYADGEVDASTAAAIEEAMETDTILAERVALFFDSRESLAVAMKPLIDEPVPEALLASVRKAVASASTGEAPPAREGLIVPFARRGASKPSGWNGSLAMPVAASILAVAIGLGGLGGFAAGRFSVPAAGQAAAVELARALSSEASGRDVAMPENGGTLRLVSSFRDAAGELCREYELRNETLSTASVACYSDGGWMARLTLGQPLAPGYSPASGEEAVDAYLGAIGAGAPLSAEEETMALAALK